jgi:hypothetical protein
MDKTETKFLVNLNSKTKRISVQKELISKRKKNICSIVHIDFNKFQMKKQIC